MPISSSLVSLFLYCCVVYGTCTDDSCSSVVGVVDTVVDEVANTVVEVGIKAGPASFLCLECCSVLVFFLQRQIKLPAHENMDQTLITCGGQKKHYIILNSFI